MRRITSVNPNRSATDYPGSALAVGSRGETVRRIQQCLNHISARYQTIPKLTEDGIFGNGTRNAVMMFQRAFGLSQDGIIGRQTWSKLMTECARANPGYILRRGSTGSDVRRLQQAINIVAGQYTSIPRLAEDGVFGGGTEQSVIAFQRRFGLTPDGLVGPATWNKLMELISGGGTPPDSGNGGGTPPDNGNGGGTPPDSGNGGGTPPGNNNPGSLSADELETFNLINQQRQNNGLPALKIDPEVQNVARIKAQDMADNNYFSHTSPTYGSPFDMLKRFGVNYSAAGENIAANPRNSGAVTAWMNSSGHRANILNSTFNYTGLGVAADPAYGKKYAQIFIEK